MTFTILANLDQEAIWAGKPLDKPVRLRISTIASLVGALAPEGPEGDDVEVFTPAEVPPQFARVPNWTPPTMRVGTPAAPDLMWADPAAKAVSDRRFGLKAARAAGFALPGARVVASLGEVSAHLAAGGADASDEGAWVCKAPWTSAGRDRCYGKGPLDDDRRAQLKKLLTQHHALVFEPWLRRIADVAVCARVDAGGVVTALSPHRLRSGPRGAFHGVSFDADLGAGEHDQLMIAAEYAGGALHRAGYAGPFGIDAFAYADRGTRRFHPFCELNVRHTFGHVAHALRTRIGIATLGFDQPPAGATAIVASAYTHTPLAWVTWGG